MRKSPLAAALVLGLSTACGGGGGGGGPDPAGPLLRAWLLHTEAPDCDGVVVPCLSRVSVLDLESRTVPLSYPLTGVDARALAVKQDGSRFFVVDERSESVRGYDSGGNPLSAVPLPFALSLVISPDDAFLYAIGGSVVVKIDVATMTPVDLLDLSPWQPRGIAVSADGTTLALAMFDPGGGDDEDDDDEGGGGDPEVAIGIVTTASLESSGTAELTGSVSGCDATPEAVAFTTYGTVLAWDGVCNELFEVDLSPLEQIDANSRFPADDSAVYGYARHCLGFSAGTGTGFVATEASSVYVAPQQPAPSGAFDAAVIGGRPFFPRAASVLPENGVVPEHFVVVALHVADDDTRGGAVAIDLSSGLPVGEITEVALSGNGVLTDLRVVPAPIP
jgi:hypothetical protein